MRGKYVSVEHATGRGAAERWRSQYQKPTGWMRTAGGDSELVYNNLCDLGLNPDIKAVADIIGNQSWSYITCDGCSDSVEIAVMLGEYEAKKYCRVCINEAASVLLSQPST